jgi:hypothetical protein
VHSLALEQLWRAATKARISSFASHVARERARSSAESPGVSSRCAQSLGLVAGLGGVAEVEAIGTGEAVGGSVGGCAGAASDADGAGVASGADGTEGASDADGTDAASAAGGGTGVLTREQATSAGALAPTSSRVNPTRVQRARVLMDESRFYPHAELPTISRRASTDPREPRHCPPEAWVVPARGVGDAQLGGSGGQKQNLGTGWARDGDGAMDGAARDVGRAMRTARHRVGGARIRSHGSRGLRSRQRRADRNRRPR